MSDNDEKRSVGYSAFDPNSTQSKPLHSPSHAHPLRYYPGYGAWNCDGNTVFGRCRGDGRINRAKRYKCTVCANFDLCEFCVQ